MGGIKNQKINRISELSDIISRMEMNIDRCRRENKRDEKEELQIEVEKYYIERKQLELMGQKWRDAPQLLCW